VKIAEVQQQTQLPPKSQHTNVRGVRREWRRIKREDAIERQRAFIAKFEASAKDAPIRKHHRPAPLSEFGDEE
jgi:hypothetical protein